MPYPSGSAGKDLLLFAGVDTITHSEERYTLYLLLTAGRHNGLTLRLRNGILVLEQNKYCNFGAHFPASSVIS